MYAVTKQYDVIIAPSFAGNQLLVTNPVSYTHLDVYKRQVLQRIAISYFLVSLIYLYSKKIRTQYIWAGAILIGYWLIIAFVPVPGFGAGNMTMEGNLCGYFDRLLLPGSFCCYPFGDNEGILSSITPVSYTHLDVYKRQGRGSSKF